MTEATKQAIPLLPKFAQRARELRQQAADWLRPVREDALGWFESRGFPTTRAEQWKNTNVAPIARTAFGPARHDAARSVTAESIRLLSPGDFAAVPRLVFVDGRHSPSLSSTNGLPEQVWLGSLAHDIAPETAGLPVSRQATVRAHLTRPDGYKDHAFAALNTALFEDGGLLLVGDNVNLEQPILLLHVSTSGEQATASFPRALIVVGRNSRVSLVESYAGPDDATYLVSAVTEVQVGENSRLDHYRVQDEGSGAYHVSVLKARQQRFSHYGSHNFDLGSRLARLDTTAVLDGEGAECLLDGLYLTGGSQHVDNHTTLDHARPNGHSREVYKGILTGSSRAVFNGRILVRPDAQKTDAKQSNPNLLLSDGALVHTRPQLEIYADDVKCTHGTTIGRLDEDAAFYLRSRGLGATEARNMLVRGFASEVLERVDVEPLRQTLEREIADRLEASERRGKPGE